MTSIDKLLGAIQARTANVPPRREVLDAIRTLEATLQEALATSRNLRGLPNLGTSRTPFYAANLRAASTATKLVFPQAGEPQGPEALVLTPQGTLAVAWAARPTTNDALFVMLWRGADDADLLIEDLERFVTRLPEVLANHLARIDRTEATWAAARDLAHRVLDLVGDR